MELKAAAQARFATIQSQMIALSHRIHAHPELGFEEEHASTWLAETLSDAGFAVTKGLYDLPTAFMAQAGSGPLHLALCAEYDSLPGVGHACGHNIIAAMALGAGFATAALAHLLVLLFRLDGEAPPLFSQLLLRSAGKFVGSQPSTIELLGGNLA